MRNGMATGSRICDILGRKQPTPAQKKANEAGDYLKKREDYLMEVVCSRLTGLSPDNYVSPAMQWGIENEPFARAAYEMAQDVMVATAGFAMHPRIKWFGASPDGMIGDDGLLEIKCPTSAVHLGYVLGGQVPIDYMPQMLAEMSCTERKWVDFVSYDPRMPANLQLFIKRWDRDEPLIAAMEEQVETFLEEVEAKMAEISQVSLL
jgi:hypothetical protein